MKAHARLFINTYLRSLELPSPAHIEPCFCSISNPALTHEKLVVAGRNLARELLCWPRACSSEKDRWGEIGARRVPTTRRAPKAFRSIPSTAWQTPASGKAPKPAQCFARSPVRSEGSLNIRICAIPRFRSCRPYIAGCIQTTNHKKPTSNPSAATTRCRCHDNKLTRRTAPIKTGQKTPVSSPP